MKTLARFGGVFAAGLLSFGGQMALAQSTCTVNGQEVPCDQLAGQVGSVLGWGLGGLTLFAVLAILATIFWIMMIVHAATHNVENKAMWIIIMVFTGIVGAIVYYFVVKRQFGKTAQPTMPTQTPPAPPQA